MSRPRAYKKDYPQVAHDINAVGLDNLRQYIRKHHPQAVKNMERNIRIIKYAVHHGPSETAKLYGFGPQTVIFIMGQYWKYAKEAQKEMEYRNADRNAKT